MRFITRAVAATPTATGPPCINVRRATLRRREGRAGLVRLDMGPPSASQTRLVGGDGRLPDGRFMRDNDARAGLKDPLKRGVREGQDVTRTSQDGGHLTETALRTVEHVSDSSAWRDFPSYSQLGNRVRVTAAQLRVLEMLVTGATYESIGRSLNLSSTTVRTHVVALQKRLNVRSNVGVVLAAVVVGLVSIDSWPVKLTGLREFDQSPLL